MNDTTPDPRVGPAETARAVCLALAPGVLCLAVLGLLRLAGGEASLALLPMLLGTLCAVALVGGAAWIGLRSAAGPVGGHRPPGRTPGRSARSTPRRRAVRVAFSLAAAPTASRASPHPAAPRRRTARPAR